jgi:hypothetical protein
VLQTWALLVLEVTARSTRQVLTKWALIRAQDLDSWVMGTIKQEPGVVKLVLMTVPELPTFLRVG